MKVNVVTVCDVGNARPRVIDKGPGIYAIDEVEERIAWYYSTTPSLPLPVRSGGRYKQKE